MRQEDGYHPKFYVARWRLMGRKSDVNLMIDAIVVCYGAILKEGQLTNHPFEFTRFSKVSRNLWGLYVTQ